MDNQSADPVGLYATDNELNALLRMLTDIVADFGSRMASVERIALQLRYHNFAEHAKQGNWTDARSEYETYMLPIIEQRIKFKRNVGEEFPAGSHALLNDFGEQLQAAQKANWASLDDIVNSSEWEVGKQGLRILIDEYYKQVQDRKITTKLTHSQIIRGFSCIERMLNNLPQERSRPAVDVSDADRANRS